MVLLDERWPTLIPMEAHGVLAQPVVYTGEIPVKVRWNFGDLVTATDREGVGTIVSTNAEDPEVRRRIDAGEQVIAAESRADAVHVARQVMQRARSIGEWEMSQTHESLLPYLEEESREFAEAVRDGAAPGQVCAELGDVFLQVLFHAEIASRRGDFDLDAVAGSFVAKMRSRAPYLFDGTAKVVSVERQEELWRAGKAAEARRD